MIKVDGGFGAMSMSLVFEQGIQLVLCSSCTKETKNEGKCLCLSVQVCKSAEEGKKGG